MNKVKNLVGASQKQIDQWSEDLLDLAPKVGKSPKELADALYFVSSSGIKTAKVLGTVKVSAQASALGLGEAEVVADALTSAMNAYADSNLTAREATNVLIKTVREGKLEADELAQSIGRVLPISSKLGVSFQDVGASLAAMSLQGLDAAEATTALRGIFSATFKPTADAKNALESVGLTAEKLRKQLKDQGHPRHAWDVSARSSTATSSRWQRCSRTSARSSVRSTWSATTPSAMHRSMTS